MFRESVISGRVRMITGPDGTLLRDIDTDQIFHNAHLAETNVKEMGKYAFGNLEGWKDFPQKALSGDIVVVGGNFGAGSSRQQAVDCFHSLGIAALIGESFAAIYKRNAINSGLALLVCPNIGSSGLKTGDHIQVNFETGEIRGMSGCAISIKGEPFSRVQLDIYQAGDLFAFGREREGGRV